MMNAMTLIVRHAFMITGFVAVMMLVIEYLNVLSEGKWQERLSRRRWGQYVMAAFLGAVPGCLGAFAVVAMYTHRRMSLGAVVAAMIATAGDESFVMFALIPRTALLLHGMLFVLGLFAGALTDKLLGRRLTAKLSCEADFTLHAKAECQCFPRDQLVLQWRHCSAARGTLSASLGLFLLALLVGQIGPPQWNWIRLSMVLASSLALFIVATVPDHFLEEHLWRHVVRGHVPRVFLWTFGALLVMHLVVEQWQIGDQVRENRWTMLAIAGLIGLIPESGPHLVFVTMYAKGLVPFSILFASSIVQDGHGMLPLLAHSPRAFLVIKLINLVVGLAVGGLIMALGQ
jgi:hypothetical protein